MLGWSRGRRWLNLDGVLLLHLMQALPPALPLRSLAWGLLLRNHQMRASETHPLLFLVGVLLLHLLQQELV